MLVLVLIAVPVIEVLVFIEVAHAIGWLLAVVLLLGTSVVGTQLLRIQGRSAMQRVSSAVAEHRAPGRAAVDAALGLLGGVLLVLPGFVTDFLGALLIFPPSRRQARGWMSRHYAGRMMRFVAATGRFRSRDRVPAPDVESTARDDDIDQLGR